MYLCWKLTQFLYNSFNIKLNKNCDRWFKKLFDIMILEDFKQILALGPEFCFPLPTSFKKS